MYSLNTKIAKLTIVTSLDERRVLRRLEGYCALLIQKPSTQIANIAVSREFWLSLEGIVN